MKTWGLKNGLKHPVFCPQILFIPFHERVWGGAQTGKKSPGKGNATKPWNKKKNVFSPPPFFLNFLGILSPTLPSHCVVPANRNKGSAGTVRAKNGFPLFGPSAKIINFQSTSGRARGGRPSIRFFGRKNCLIFFPHFFFFRPDYIGVSHNRAQGSPHTRTNRLRSENKKWFFFLNPQKSIRKKNPEQWARRDFFFSSASPASGSRGKLSLIGFFWR